jgi:hypothetical protein
MLRRRCQTVRVFTVLPTVVLIARIWTGLSGTSTNMLMYKVLIRPVLTYASETWTVKELSGG